jgi:hypothetical protein
MKCWLYGCILYLRLRGCYLFFATFRLVRFRKAIFSPDMSVRPSAYIGATPTWWTFLMNFNMWDFNSIRLHVLIFVKVGKKQLRVCMKTSVRVRSVAAIVLCNSDRLCSC